MIPPTSTPCTYMVPLVVLTVSSFIRSLAFSPPSSHPSSRLHATTSTNTNHPKISKPLTITGPPPSTKPDYTSIHGPLGPIVDEFLLSLFRSKLASRLGVPLSKHEIAVSDSSLPINDYNAIIELTHSMNIQYSNRTTVQTLAQEVLISLFPEFILDRFPSWFARPFPQFSAEMCAHATVAFGTWLMGECSVNDVPSPTSSSGSTAEATVGKGVLVQRCRFLQESQCASICVNSCKIPTQNFFSQQMGLELTMTPNYETFECQFAFGIKPSEEEERMARETPCLSLCPSGGGMRSWHDNDFKNNGRRKEEWLMDLERLAEAEKEGSGDGISCALMEDLA